MKKKTIILIAIIASAILSIFIWSISMPSRLVYFGGSSSVNPFMQIATKEFDEGQDDYELIYNSNGSQNGVRSVENGTYSAGMISKEIKESTLSEGKSAFSDYEVFDNSDKPVDLTIDNNFVTFSNAVRNGSGINAVEFAIDAIVIMYNPPRWVDEVDLDSIDLQLENKEHKNIIKNIYTNSKYKWSDFLIDLNKGDIIAQNRIAMNASLDIEHGNDLMVPISRESGSGTRSSFDGFFGIKDVNSGTANSNGSMITQLRDTNGSFGYVSYGFYKNSTNNNLQTPWMNGHKLGQDGYVKSKGESALVNDKLTNNDYIKDVNGYLLKRPFIMLFDSNDKFRDIVLDFIQFLIKEDKEGINANEAYEEEGLVKNILFFNRNTIPNDSK